MSIATRFSHYLATHNIHYQTLSHSHSTNSIHSAVSANIPFMNIAKAVILEDHDGKHLMAVLPANAKISLSQINQEFHGRYHLVKERNLYGFFADCEHGAVPPVGSAYHMSMICDKALMGLEYIYLEAGDHETLIKLDNAAFRKLMGQSRLLSFASQVVH